VVRVSCAGADVTRAAQGTQGTQSK
jgi:hypothetical protein